MPPALLTRATRQIPERDSTDAAPNAAKTSLPVWACLAASVSGGGLALRLTWRIGAAPPALILVAALCLARPLTAAGLPFGTDSLLHLYRALDFYQTLGSGAVWPRIAPSLYFGHGYPVFEFYSPGLYYLAAALQAAGLSLPGALKGILWLALILPGFGAYLYARTALSPWPAAAAAVLYLAAPYHLFDTYFRGGYTEPLAYTFFPLALWAIARAGRQPGWATGAWIGLILSLLILTHNLSAFLFTPFAALAVLVYGMRAAREKGRQAAMGYAASIGSGVLLAGLLTAIHWLPIVADAGTVHLGRLTRFRYADFFTLPEHLLTWDPIAQIGGAGVEDTGAGNLHLLQTFGVIVGILLILGFWRRSRRLRWDAALWSVQLTGGLFLVTSSSGWVWDAVPLLELAQFPWRFLGPVCLPAALLAAAGIELVATRWRPGLAFAFALAAIVAAGPLGVYQTGFARDDLERGAIAHFELAVGADGGATGEWLPREVTEAPRVSAWALAAATGDAWPRSPERPLPGDHGAGLVRSYQFRDWPGGSRVLDTAYFPGWTAQRAGQTLPVAADPATGLIAVKVPAGDWEVTLRFAGTPLQQLAGLISLAAFSALALAALWFGRRHRPRWTRDRLVAVGAGLLVVGLPLVIFGLRVALAEPTERRPADVAFGPYVVTDYQLSVESVMPGDRLPIEVGWRSTGPPAAGTIVARLTNRTSLTWAAAEAPAQPAGPERQSSRFELLVPEGTPPGSYQVQIGFRQNDRDIPATRLGLIGHFQPIADLRVGPVSVQARPESAAPGGESPGEGNPRLRSAAFRVRAGDWWRGESLQAPGPLVTDVVRLPAGHVLRGEWLWQVGASHLPDLEMAFQLADETGHVWAEHAFRPVDGLYPTTYWRPGEAVRDQQDLYLRPDLPPGTYRARVAIRPPDVPAEPESGVPSTVWPVGTVILEPPRGHPNPAEYTTDRLDREIFPGLRLLTSRPSADELAAGSELAIDSRWLATRGDLLAFDVRWELVDERGHVWASVAGPPTGLAGYPSTDWTPATIVRGYHRLTIDPFAPAGEYRLRLVATAAGGQVLGETTLGPLRLPVQSRVLDVEPEVKVAALFGEAVVLAGFDPLGGVRLATDRSPVELALPAGETPRLRLYWQSRAPVARSYTVFLQILDESGRLVAQHDGLPQGGARPTDTWVSGEFVADDRAIEWATGPPGRYQVIAGLYDAETGRRLSTADGADFVRLATLTILNPRPRTR